MINVIEQLEMIGQNSSLQQHDSLIEMLSELDVKKESIMNFNKQEFVCMLVPDDDDDSDESDDSGDDSTE